MSHYVLTYQPPRAECTRGTYVLIELVLSISFKGPRLNAVMRYAKVIPAGKLKLPKAGKVYQSVSPQQLSLLSPWHVELNRSCPRELRQPYQDAVCCEVNFLR